LKLLNWPKPLRDQLILELPTLNALRTDEVATLKAEYIDLANGDLEVLDSKKHSFFTVPLDYTVAKHLELYLSQTGIKEGLIITPGTKAGRRTKGSLSNQAIEYIWKKWCLACGIPYMPPRYGRAYFAADWHIIQGKSIIGLMNVLRHDSFLATWKYLTKIYCYEDVKAEFQHGVKSPFASECARSDSCPLASEDCRCRMYTPHDQLKTVQEAQHSSVAISEKL